MLLRRFGHRERPPAAHYARSTSFPGLTVSGVYFCEMGYGVGNEKLSWGWKRAPLLGEDDEPLKGRGILRILDRRGGEGGS